MRNALICLNCKVRWKCQRYGVDLWSKKLGRNVLNFDFGALRWVPAASSSAGEISAASPQWGEGPDPGWRHHYNHSGEPEEGGSRGDQEGGGDRYRHGGGGGCVTAVSVPVFCLQQHLLYHGISQSGVDTTLCHCPSEISCRLWYSWDWPADVSACFQMHFLYQYSLHFFLDTYHTVLYENPNLKGISDHSQRLAVITKDLFQVWNKHLNR